jgi:hypothetical protein
MYECKGSCIFTGVGKSGFVAKKVSPNSITAHVSCGAIFPCNQRDPPSQPLRRALASNRCCRAHFSPRSPSPEACDGVERGSRRVC